MRQASFTPPPRFYLDEASSFRLVQALSRGKFNNCYFKSGCKSPKIQTKQCRWKGPTCTMCKNPGSEFSRPDHFVWIDLNESFNLRFTVLYSAVSHLSLVGFMLRITNAHMDHCPADWPRNEQAGGKLAFYSLSLIVGTNKQRSSRSLRLAPCLWTACVRLQPVLVWSQRAKKAMWLW